MFIIIVFNSVLRPSSSIPSEDIFCSTNYQSRDVTPHLGVFVILQCSSFRVHESSFLLLLLRQCSNRCAEAFVVFRNSHLNRLAVI